jgi:hypothetical protein
MAEPLELDRLTFALVAKFRGHGHLCNVLTHVGSGNWRAIEQSIATILRPRARAARLGVIDRNIVELVAGGRGITGPIMRSVFFDTVAREAGAQDARRIRRKIAGLHERMHGESRPAAKRSHTQPAATTVAEHRHLPRAMAEADAWPLGKAA